MELEGYTDDDWEADWRGIIQSFVQDNSQESMISKLQRSQPLNKDDKTYMLRFLQLKYAVLFLQNEKAFGKFCFYGCWCLPRGAADIGAGHGKPIDKIDEACRDYSTCYNCLYSDSFGRKCSENDSGNYRMTGQMDPRTKEKFLMCSMLKNQLR